MLEILILSSIVLNGFSVRGVPQSRCEKISVSMCQGIGYNTTLMPNFVGHENQSEAASGLQNFSDILKHECSPYLRLFVCSVYVPMCSEYLPGAIPACRGLCEEVKNDCLPALLNAGLTWPQKIDCSRFPEPPDLCMQQPTEEDSNHHANQVNDLLIDDHIRGFKSSVKSCPRNTILIDNNCVKVCNSDSRYSASDRHLFEIWSGVGSLLCIIVTVFAFLTFMIEPKRFRWPARPILFLTICGFITSSMYLLRWILGSFTCTGGASIIKPYNLLCVSIALVVTFCEFAFCMWWCIFCLVWYLSAAKEWSTEAIERTSQVLHAVTWTTSTMPVIYALVSNNITINEFSGLCEINSYISIICQMIFVLAGAIMAVLTSVALKNVRKALIYAGRSPYKLERLIYRLGVISSGICFPLFICLMCYFVDTLTVALMKTCLRLLSAIFASFWVFSSKTFKSWNKILRPPFSNHKNLHSVPVTKV